MQARLKVLVFIDWFYPAYKAGGPIKSVYSIVQSLNDYFDFLIITSNNDLDGCELNVPTNQYVENFGCKVIYLEKSKQSYQSYAKYIEEFQADVIYYNSLFSWSFTLLPYLKFRNKSGVKHILAPRGMLGSGSLSVKPIKKKIFLLIAKNILFKKTIRWHASSEYEEKDIKSAIGNNAEVMIAQNLSSGISKNQLSRKKEKGKLKLVFLSRVLDIKNLHFALTLMNDLSNIEGLTLDIYGPIEDQEYWQKCVDLINNDSRIEYRGIVNPQEVSSVAQQYDFLILPTKHENYGHVIVEFLLAGVPVLISQLTPWKNLEKQQIGFDISLEDVIEWKEKIQQLISMDHETYSKYEFSCHKFSKENILKEETILANKKLFEQDIRL